MDVVASYQIMIEEIKILIENKCSFMYEEVGVDRVYYYYGIDCGRREK